MNRKTLTALLGIGLIPSLLFGQFYRMDVDLQQPGQARVIDRVFTGNTVGLDVGFWDGDSAFAVTNWSMFFKYTDGQYSTNDMDSIPGTTSSNRVVFDSTTNIFYSASENYYFSIFGIDGAGRRRTFARGRLIEEYDPAASTSLGVSTGGVYIVPWGGIYGDPASSTSLVSYVTSLIGELGEPLWSAESNSVVSGIASNSANIAAVSGRVDTVEGWGDHAEAGYLTDFTETDPEFAAWLATGPLDDIVVDETDPAFSAWRTNALAGSTNAIVAGELVDIGELLGAGGGSGISAAEAGQIATNVASGYLPLSGYDGLVVLGTRTRGYAASTNLGSYGFSAGRGTSAGEYGFAAGLETSAGYAGFAVGFGTSAGPYGFAAGVDTSAGDFGFAVGDSTSAGNFGFAAGRMAKGAEGSFVFADNPTGWTPFIRTNYPNEFAARAAGGVYFDTPMMVVTGTVSAGSITLGTNAPITNWPEGGTGTGWTNLAFSGTGNAITNATAAGTTLTLERGTIEGGGGGDGGGGVVSTPLIYLTSGGSTNVNVITANTANGLFLDLSAPTAVLIEEAASATNVSSFFSLELRGTNQLTLYTPGAVVTGFPERVWLRTNRTVGTVWRKFGGDTVWHVWEE